MVGILKTYLLQSNLLKLFGLTGSDDAKTLLVNPFTLQSHHVKLSPHLISLSFWETTILFTFLF